jgi:AcrR family transcriptional regulator
MPEKEKVSSTKKKILESALRLFSTKGYLGATTKEIAKDSKIAEITLFRHFPSKEKLLEEVINTYSFLPVLRELIPEIEKKPYEKALIIIARRFLKTLDSRKELIQIMHSEVRRYPEKVHKIYHDFIDETIKTLAAYFTQMYREGYLRRFDTEIAARAFLGMFFSFFNSKEFHMLQKFKKLDTENVIKNYVNIFIRGTVK